MKKGKIVLVSIALASIFPVISEAENWIQVSCPTVAQLQQSNCQVNPSGITICYYSAQNQGKDNNGNVKTIFWAGSGSPKTPAMAFTGGGAFMGHQVNCGYIAPTDPIITTLILVSPPVQECKQLGTNLFQCS